MTGHPDHVAASHWTADIARAYPSATLLRVVQCRDAYHSHLQQLDKQFDIYFNIDKPPLIDCQQASVYLQLSADVWAKKRAALAAMPSQTEGLLAQITENDLHAAFATETLQIV